MSQRLKIEGVTKKYTKKVVLNNLSFEADPGEFIVLVGPSGCGKSTMLRCVAGLETINDGRVYIGDRDVSGLDPKDRHIAMVFQDYALYPHKNVYENIAFGLRIRKMPEVEIDRLVQWAAEKLDLQGLLERKPAALSGGQRQRVAIGRAIVRKPQVFLFDEPLSNLDAKLRAHMRLTIAKLHKDLQVTVLYVTHDQVEAMTLADRIIVLNAGRIQQMGKPLHLYYHPSNIFVASFIGSPSMNLLDGKLADVQGALHFRSESGLLFKVPETFAANLRARVKRDQDVVWGVRPENFKFVKTGETPENRFKAKVLLTEPLGASTSVYCEIDGHSINLSVPEPHRPMPGDELDVCFASKHLYMFDKQSTNSVIEV